MRIDALEVCAACATTFAETFQLVSRIVGGGPILAVTSLSPTRKSPGPFNTYSLPEIKYITPTAHSLVQLIRAPFFTSAMRVALPASSAASPLISVTKATPLLCACPASNSIETNSAETKYFVNMLSSQNCTVTGTRNVAPHWAAMALPPRHPITASGYDRAMFARQNQSF